MSVRAEFKGNAGHLFNKIKWMYISTSDKGCKYSKNHGKGDDEVVIDYDDKDIPCGIWIKKPYEIEIFDQDDHKDIVALPWDEGESVIMMDTIPMKDETTMKIMNEYEDGDGDDVAIDAATEARVGHPACADPGPFTA